MEFTETMTLGDYLAGFIAEGGTEFIRHRITGLGLNVSTLINSCLLCSITIYGIKFMAGELATTGKQMIIMFVWLILGMGITSESIYLDLMFTIFEVRDNLTAYLMLGNTDYSIYQSFSIANNKMFVHAVNLFNAAGWTDIFMILTAASIFLIYGIYYFLFIAITLFCDLSLIILMIFGAIIIPISAFQSCRGLMKSWLTAILKYCTVFAVVGVIVSILNFISTDLIGQLMSSVYVNNDLIEDKLDAMFELTILGGVLMVGAFGIYLLMSAMEFATEMTGGVMSDGGKGVSAITNSAKSVMRGGGGMLRNGGSALQYLKGKTK